MIQKEFLILFFGWW